jgi:hypothetical protein
MLERLSSSYKHIPLVTGRMRGVRIIIQGTPYYRHAALRGVLGSLWWAHGVRASSSTRRSPPSSHSVHFVCSLSKE